MSFHLCSLAAGMSDRAADSSSETADNGADGFTACLDRIRRGDQRAAEELVLRLQPLVQRVVRAHRVRRTPQEDLAQETFIKLFTRLDQYEGRVPITHWVARIARRTCLDHLRAQRIRPEYRWADLEQPEADRLNRVAASSDRCAGEGMARRELVQTLFARLPQPDQTVLRLAVLEEKSLVEIGRLTGWTRGTIKIRTFRARRKLHRLFQELEASENRPRIQEGRS